MMKVHPVDIVGENKRDAETPDAVEEIIVVVPVTPHEVLIVPANRPYHPHRPGPDEPKRPWMLAITEKVARRPIGPFHLSRAFRSALGLTEQYGRNAG